MISIENQPSDGQSTSTVCVAQDVHHSYGDHVALDGVELEIHAGEIFALLGPNGSGKTTLFRLLCTLLPIQRGCIRIGGFDSRTNPLAVRGQIGIVFQSPSLDKKLTVDENIACQGALYGIKGADLAERRDELLRQLDLTDRRGDYCETSLGWFETSSRTCQRDVASPTIVAARRTEHRARPGGTTESLGRDSLDGRRWHGRPVDDTSVGRSRQVRSSRDHVGRQDHCRRFAAGLAEPKWAKVWSQSSRSDVVRVERMLRDDLGLNPQRVQQQLRLQSDSPGTLVPVLVEKLGDEAQSIVIGRPSLEDVFIAKTGQEFAT